MLPLRITAIKGGGCLTEQRCYVGTYGRRVWTLYAINGRAV